MPGSPCRCSTPGSRTGSPCLVSGASPAGSHSSSVSRSTGAARPRPHFTSRCGRAGTGPPRWLSFSPGACPGGRLPPGCRTSARPPPRHGRGQVGGTSKPSSSQGLLTSLASFTAFGTLVPATESLYRDIDVESLDMEELQEFPADVVIVPGALAIKNEGDMRPSLADEFGYDNGSM
ncbi:hypothetical protein OPV22_029541 [Ensete ventricosum]|uniref:DJ-1/PfpI domain-containing protein n=1 Tax=Ensete ventricosum TaxID=4639 RepID=A0AAV8QDX8_ENSVE|nr:hypothetical protein OPV22_029541 [Ensete ventricosum]